MNSPNILLILTDQERQRDWLPDGLELPARQRLIDGGIEFTNYYTHSSPCSPSRATIFTGEYMAGHGVTENSTGPQNTQLSKSALTLGKLLREQGYYTSYKGKWHLEAQPHPDMDAYGFSDWTGNDMSFWGLAGSGTEYDEPIARDAAEWIRSHSNDDNPWFLSVGLVNPHDIMWFPMDQPWYWERDPEETAFVRQRLAERDWGRADNLPGFPYDLDRWFTELPANFDDDLHTKPEVHRRWMTMMERKRTYGSMDHSDTDMWLQHLDYYVKLHELNDQNVGKILSALDDSDSWDNTIVVFTSDHGDQCGSHGLRSKGPWNYQETMRIPLYVCAPGITKARTKTNALASHVDLARTIAEFAGIDTSQVPTMVGESLYPLFKDQSTKIRDYVLFAQEWPWYQGVENCRYASSGIFDGRYKYCRYYGIGGRGSYTNVEGYDGTKISSDTKEEDMLFGRDAAFEDHDHELYDLQEDPHELVNLALDRGKRGEVRSRFAELRVLEHEIYGNGY